MYSLLYLSLVCQYVLVVICVNVLCVGQILALTEFAGKLQLS